MNEENFKAELYALLEKYDAELYLEDLSDNVREVQDFIMVRFNETQHTDALGKWVTYE
jgi:hypothetical protein